MNRAILVGILVGCGMMIFVLMNSLYTVSEVEQAIITQFGRPVGEPVTTAGLKFEGPLHPGRQSDRQAYPRVGR